ncbi:hypothetical protein [Oceanobacillus kimchii]|uniref:hypothetical protein n=1 Tax=Oceanobacillus kimchii TaxID=746691 RepID=UPI003B02C8C4
MINKTIITRLQEEGHTASCYIDEEQNILVYVINGDEYVTFDSKETKYKDAFTSEYANTFKRFLKDNGGFINM